MGERMDPRRAVGPAHDPWRAAPVARHPRAGRPVSRPRSAPGPQHIADGAPGQRRGRRTSARHPAAIRPRTVGGSTCLAAASDHAGARDQLLGLPLDERRACAFAISGASRSRSLALSSSSRDCSTIVSGGHAATVSSTTPSTADRAAACLVLLQRRLQYRPALEHQAFRPDRPSGRRANGSSRAPLRLTINQPKPGQPAAVVQRAKKSLDIGTVLATR